MKPLFKQRGFTSRLLVGKTTAFDLASKSKGKNVIYNIPGKGRMTIKGSGVSPDGQNVHILKTRGASGENPTYYKLHGDLPDFNDAKSAQSKLKGAQVLSKKELSEYQKVRNLERSAENSKNVGSIAHNLGVRGGVVKKMADNPVPVVLGAGALGGVGLAGRDSYKNVSRENNHKATNWGREPVMDKQSHLNTFLQKKANLGAYMVGDAVTDVIGGKGDSRGLTGGLSYTLSKKILPLSTRIQLQDTMADNFASKFSGEAGKAALDGLNSAMKGVFSRVKERNVDIPKRRALLSSISKSDPILSTIPKDSLKSWYNTLASYAPNVSLDKNLVTSFLKQVAQYDGQMDFGKLKELLELEGSYNKVHMGQS